MGINRFNSWTIYRLRSLYGVSYEYLFGEVEDTNHPEPLVADTESRRLTLAIKLVQKILSIRDPKVIAKMTELVEELAGKGQGS